MQNLVILATIMGFP